MYVHCDRHIAACANIDHAEGLFDIGEILDALAEQEERAVNPE